MIYTCEITYEDKAGDTCTNSFCRTDREFTNAMVETFVSEIQTYTNCTVVGWSRTASDGITLGTGVNFPTKGNVDRKVSIPVKDEEGSSAKWLIPDPTGTASKGSGQETETLDSATVIGIVSAIAKLLTRVFTPGICRVLQRLG